MSNRHFLLATSILSGAVLTASAAFAQDQVAAADEPAVSELIVTGTRLRLPDYVLPNPVTSTGAAEIAASGQANITEFLEGVPALVSSLDDITNADQSTPQNVGLNLLNLRNLGSDRTLVLVNGRRHVAGNPGTAAVDVNAIPVDLISRVDVLTGGSSAIYGADAVSGVVNFILKDNFEGLSTHSQIGAPEHGGGLTRFSSLTWGKNVRDAAGNVTMNVEYYNRDDVKFDQRIFTAPGHRRIRVGNPAETDQDTNTAGDDPDVVDNILAANTRYIDTSLEGSIITADDFAYRWLGTNTPFVKGIQTGDFIAIGGSGSQLDAYSDDLIPGSERFNFNTLAHYDFSDRVKVFGELKYTKSNADFEGQPSYDYGLFIPIDNPFIPSLARADFNANAAKGTDIATAFGLPDGVLVGRDNFDLGRERWELARQTFRSVLGLRGDLTPHINYESSLTYGFSEQRQHSFNVRINERFFAATDVVLDAQGNPACRSTLDPTAVPTGDVFAQFPFDPATFGTTFTPGANSGCVPVNIFGLDRFSKEARDWINTDLTEKSRISQFVWNSYLSGTSEDHFKLPGGGPVSFVLGAEYRKENSRYNPDPIELLSEDLQYPITINGRAATTEGEFSVTEGFAELSLPFLVDKPFAKDLTLIGAYRYSDYSTAGAANTWNVGLTYRPIQDLMFRGARARAVRAPNINDLFQGRSQSFETLLDPCASGNLNQGENPALRQAQCAADLAAIGIKGPFTDTSSEAVGGFVGGNPDLAPEQADTITYGVVATPRFVSGLSISADYYLIKIANAIQPFSAQTIVNNCYDLPRPNQFCALIDRQSASDAFPGRIASFEQVPGNISTYKTSGYDITLRYKVVPSRFGIDRDIGVFNLGVIYNHLEDLVFLEQSGAIPNRDDGEALAPKNQVTLDVTWDRGPWTVNYGFNYFDRTLRFSRTTLENNPDFIDPQYFKYKARHEHDIQVTYRAPKTRFGPEGRYELYGGINNIADQRPEFEPPRAEGGSDFTYPVSPMGRFYYVGLRTRWQ